MSQTLGLRSHLCARIAEYLATVLMEWSQYFTDKIIVGEGNSAVVAEKDERLGLKKCFRFALYVSPTGEKVLQAIVKKSENSASVTEALKKVETFTAQRSVLRIWYGSDWEPPVFSVFHKFWDRASEDDYKAISSFPEGDVTEVGYYSGPLHLRSMTDFDYDLSKADGTSWICLSCREVFNDFENHGFLREWKAVEEFANNGHSLGTHLTEHLNGEVYCKECGCYSVIDEKTGLEVNNSY